MSINEKFSKACEQIRAFTKRPSDADMLDAYALYKQASIGDVNTQKPTGDAQKKAQWEAWAAKKGTTQDAAKQAYVAKVSALAESCA